MVLQAIKYDRGKLQILDQLRLPHEEVYIDISTSYDAFEAIKSMKVRGAPAIALVAALGLAVHLAHTMEFGKLDPGSTCADFIHHQMAYLVSSRPTAVNLADAAKKLTQVADDAASRPNSTVSTVTDTYTRAAVHMLITDVQDNEDIGEHGAAWIQRIAASYTADGKLSVLTHCNTGSLATAGYGTALGVIRSLHARGILKQAFFTETRPYNQGSRLTGYELMHDNIPATLITDSMAAALLKLKKESEGIAAVIVGADRVSANGDTANKIGTYSLAILARHHDVKFLVAAPRTTIDLNTASGADIVIEQRAPKEVMMLKGPQIKPSEDGDTVDIENVRMISIAAVGTQAWNPAFDVTPADLIDGIVTEKGVVEKHSDGRFCFDTIFHEASDQAEGKKEDAKSMKGRGVEDSQYWR